ncbi:hypothetical protein L2Y90_33775 (plasmid) [Burkholderia pyrrocinia]|uniref:hypothetical protein n=1 Tax=Burkholderia pyrrocinia TaxID=60550 RepID=UPI00215AE3F2|nr:hypothetical protein [Burkholderia pyrrocinia]UVE70093.1 hypothetical protein L2Y90_33775 [Burkholderia pyrrocinia]
MNAILKGATSKVVNARVSTRRTLRAIGSRNDARLTDVALSKAGSGVIGARATAGTMHRPATASMQNVPLQPSPDQ